MYNNNSILCMLKLHFCKLLFSFQLAFWHTEIKIFSEDDFYLYDFSNLFPNIHMCVNIWHYQVQGSQAVLSKHGSSYLISGISKHKIELVPYEGFSSPNLSNSISLEVKRICWGIYTDNVKKWETGKKCKLKICLFQQQPDKWVQWLYFFT